MCFLMIVISCLHLFILVLFIWFVEWLTGVVASVNAGWRICANARHSEFLRSVWRSGAVVRGGGGGRVSHGGVGSVWTMGMVNMSGCGVGSGGMG